MSQSIKTQLTRYILLTFIATTGVLVLGIWIIREISVQQQFKIEASKLSSNILAQSDQILPGLLIQEEAASVALKLARIRQEEGLLSADFIAPDAFPTLGLSSCETFRDKIQICKSPSEIKMIAPIGAGSDLLGYLVKTKAQSYEGLDAGLFKAVSFLLAVVAFAFLFLISLILFFIDKHVRKPLLNMHEHLGPILEGKSSEINTVFRLFEVSTVASQIQDLVARYEEKKLKAAVGELAAQVAHDVRSPLSVLSIITKTNENLPDDQKRLLESATARIRNIADDLLNKYRNDNKNTRRESIKLGGPTLALTTADRILAEKRTLYLSKNIGFNLEVEEGAASVFLGIEPMALSRILSNLIDNSVEALSSHTEPQIYLRLKKALSALEIEIADNGCGIAPEVLPKLGEKGATFNKDHGTGLGLYHARVAVEGLGGRFDIESKLGEGTCVRLRIPSAEAPDWFTDRVSIRADQKLVIVDDDPTIHEFLKTKLKGFEILHCRNDYVSSLQRLSQDTQSLFMMDNKLSSTGPSGLDLIQKFYLSYHSVVMTSDFDEIEIQRRVMSLGCKMIPKPLLPYLKIEKLADSTEMRYDLVLIDDDELMRSSWTLHAQMAGRKIGVFKNLQDFLDSGCAKSTAVYIDFHLDGMNGLQVAAELRTQGYHNLHLATGSASDEITSIPEYILSVRGKEFPLL